MFIGHYAVAYLFVALVPGVPPLIPLLGVSFPDLLWPVLVLAGIEKVRVDPGSARQDAIGFISYPYSHSLVLGTLIAGVFGAGIAILYGLTAGIVFAAASASHWILDTIVHKRDLPVLGFGPDTKAGAGLWRFGPAAFFLELAFYCIVTWFAAPPGTLVPLLVLGIAFHLVNANSFFGFSRKNPFGSARSYALVALGALVAFSLIANRILTGGF